MIEASALAYLEVVNRVASRQIRDRIKPTATWGRMRPGVTRKRSGIEGGVSHQQCGGVFRRSG